MKKVYHLSTCNTCQRIIKELGIGDEFSYQNIKTEAISELQLEEMKKLAGNYESLFSRVARKYRALGLNEIDLNEADYKKYILEEYTFLLRPTFIIDGEIFIGNSKKNVEAVKQKLNA